MSLEQEANAITEERLKEAKYAIDRVFYRGYAEKNPEMIVAYLHSVAYENRTLLQFGAGRPRK